MMKAEAFCLARSEPACASPHEGATSQKAGRRLRQSFSIAFGHKSISSSLAYANVNDRDADWATSRAFIEMF
jgi:hypothetical protein